MVKTPSADARVSEVNEALLKIPSYADDSMFFMARYAGKVKDRLPTAEWNEFFAITTQANKHWVSGKCDQVELDVSDEELDHREKMLEYRQKAIDMIKDHPDLVNDYDQFTACTLAAVRSTRG